MSNVVLMLNVACATTDQNVHVSQTILEIHMIDVGDQSVLLTLIAPQHSHVEMKNVLILAIVLKMLIAHLEIIEEYVIAVLDIQEIHMA